MEQKNTKKMKIILTAVLTVCVVFAAVFGFVYAEKKKDFSSNDKTAISMGTVITSKLYGDATEKENETVISIINQLDDVISWRKENSVISRFNRDSQVSLPEIADVVETCLAVSKDSDGAFDITIAPVSKLWDFGGENERLPQKSEIENALKKVNYQTVKVSGSVIECEKGQSIDLGAVGKGYACDLVYQYLKQTSVKGAAVSVGGSIVVYGKRNAVGDKWRVAVRDPRDENAVIGVVNLEEGFVSTSGDYERYFEKDGVRYHHLLDARTGYPADSSLISVTIICDNGLLSDALSTACFLLGKEKGAELAKKYGASAIFVDSEENISVIGDVDFQKTEG